MSTAGFWPESMTPWRGERVRLGGRDCYTFRRSGGITMLVVQTERGWTVTKMKGGHVLDMRDVKLIPRHVRDAMDKTKTGVR